MDKFKDIREKLREIRKKFDEETPEAIKKAIDEILSGKKLEAENNDPINEGSTDIDEEQAKKIIQEIFGGSKDIFGIPSMPTREGFFELAKNGRKVWNTWRKSNPLCSINMSGINFSDTTIDFSGFIFSSSVPISKCDFSNCTFGLFNRFSDILFSKEITFKGSKFNAPSNFENCSFGQNCNFDGVEFNSEFRFTKCFFSIDSSLNKLKSKRKISFIGCDFPGKSHFRDLDLEDHPKFEQCVFHGESYFEKSIFLHGASFAGSIFKKKATFDDALFGDGTSFHKAQFERAISAKKTTFGNNTRFDESKLGPAKYPTEFGATEASPSDFSCSSFGENTSFNAAKLGERTDFSRANIGKNSHFRATTFGYKTKIDHTDFGPDCDFTLSRFGDECSLIGASFGRNIIFDASIFGENIDFSAAEDSIEQKRKIFQKISFSGATFLGNASFIGRKFTGTTEFGIYSQKKNPPRSNYEKTFLLGMPNDKKCVFFGIPKFYDCELYRDTTFDGAMFKAKPSQEAARAYRTLKEFMERYKAVSEERSFHRLEMLAEKTKWTRIEKLASVIYEICSGYGSSIWRPIVTLLLSSIFFGFLYCALSTAPIDLNSGGAFDFVNYISLNTFPVPGFDKTQMQLREKLFGTQGLNITCAILLELAHKTVSLVCTFFLGLSLRNLFRMKS